MVTTANKPGSVSAAALVTPLPGVDLDDNFGEPRPEGRTHEGIDIFAPHGTEIHAISGGTVVNSFFNELGGKVVYIQGDDGRLYYYAHLDSIRDLELGDRIETGAVVGTVGNTGNAASTPPHLHLQIREDGEWINPYPFLEELAEPVVATDAYAIDPGPPPQVADGDGDGLTDEFETLLGTDAARSDSDDDGLTDLHETTVSHTDPLASDTDGDGEPDAVEVAAGTDAGLAPLPEAAVAAGFGGLATRDSDGDGLSDEWEIDHGLDPHAADTDADALPDALEIALGSSAVSNDSDQDGVTDGWEYELGTLLPLELPEAQQPFGAQTFGAAHAHSHAGEDGAHLASAAADDAAADVD